MRTLDRGRKAKLKFELESRGIRQSDIAAKADLSEATVSKVISGTYPVATDEGRRTVERVEAVIADMTGCSFEDLLATASAA